MSTDLMSLAHGRRTSRLLLAAAVMGAACTQPTTTRIEAICASPPAAAVVPVTIMVDTVESAAPLQLRQDLGKSYDLTLTLLPAESATPQACPDRSGIVTYADGIPTALANASAGSGNSVWRIDGANVVVDFAPSYRDNNFALSLPLAGGDGQWSLSTFAGPVARGRVIRR